jgi:purine-binding chemotaxis protein CheW
LSTQSDKPSKQGAKRDIQTRIEEPDDALKSYLDTLLSEIDTPPVITPHKPKRQPRVAPKSQTQSAVRTETPAPSRTESRAKPLSEVKVKELLADADIQVKDPTPAPLTVPQMSREAQQPEWANQPFQVLLFKVNGITMGIPLNALVGILTYQGQAKPLPGQPGWSMGIVLNREDKVVVVDTARLLMPERVDQEQRVTPQHLLLIGQGDRALAVDAICEIRQIEKEQIRWRRGDQYRPWYAGIIVQELSVLLNVEGVLSLLAA